MRTSPSDEFLADLEQLLVESGIPADAAQSAAVAVGVRWGGQSVYIRLRGPYLACAVASAFTGNNANELSTRFRISRAQVYKLVAKARSCAHAADSPQAEQARLPGT